MSTQAGAEGPISPVRTSAPEFVISAASINAEPVELDATPASSERMRLARRDSRAMALEAFQAEKTAREAESQRREELITKRKEDPAVLVDIPQTPRPEELERSGASEGYIRST